MKGTIFFATALFYSGIAFGMIESNTENLSKRNLSFISFEENEQSKKIKLSDIDFIEEMRHIEEMDPPFLMENQTTSLPLPSSSQVANNEEQCSQQQFDQLLQKYINLDQVDLSEDRMLIESRKWIFAANLKRLYMLDGRNFTEACKFGVYFPNLRKLMINANDFSSIKANEVEIPQLAELKVIGRLSTVHDFVLLLSMLRESLIKLQIDASNLLNFKLDKLNLQKLKELKLTGSILTEDQLRELEETRSHLSGHMKSRMDKIVSFLLNLKSSLKILDLSNARLIGKSKKFIYSMGELSKLDYLNLSKNRFTTVPRAIKNLKDLVYLDFSNNKIKIGIPEWMINLNNLTHLDLSRNEITTIPKIIEALPQLTYLNFSLNYITKVPDSIWNLKKLSHLDLSGNNVTIVSAMIKKAQNLTYLDLANNRIKTLPNSIGTLLKLTHLDLFGNQGLKFLPNSIVNLFDLEYLDIRRTGINALSIIEWMNRENLQRTRICGNTLKRGYFG